MPPQLSVTPEEIEAAKKKFGLEEVTQPIFGLNPGAEYGPAKRWPIERFIAASTEIQQRTNCLWLIFGGRGDSPIYWTNRRRASRLTFHASRFVPVRLPSAN